MIPKSVQCHVRVAAGRELHARLRGRKRSHFEAIGTAMFTFEGIGVVLPIENQMKTPKDMRGWNGVLNIAMAMVTSLYMAVGVFGYLKYGENVLGSITLNLPSNEL